ncbi:MAG: primosomal protein N' [Candidatus Magasanikbacteria bacterium]|nr:primosomal protein N' [Candidatus Magasanikbacteria bacterium]
MIIKVAPIKRLPAKVSEFDYSVPKELTKKIHVGQMVIIPFRKSEIFGLVLAVDIKQKYGKTKQIKSIVSSEPFLTKNQLNFYKSLSLIYKTSLGDILKKSLLPLKKNKLKKIELKSHQNDDSNSKIAEKKSKSSYCYYKNEKEHKKCLLSCIKGQTLILVPEIHLIDDIRRLLPIEKQKQTVVWHSELGDKQKYDRWIQVRNGEKNIIIGTRSAIFLAFFDLESIIIDYEHDENHKHWDQTPRFYDKDIARLYAYKFSTKIKYMSFSPSCTSYYHIHKDNYNLLTDKKLSIEPIKASIFDIAKERQTGNFDLLSYRTEELIENSKNDIFLMTNRLGFATSLNCEKCAYTAKCPDCSLPMIYIEKENQIICKYCKKNKTLPIKCPQCKINLGKLKGKAIQYVEKRIKKIMKNKKNYKILRIDSTISEKKLYTKKRKIIIGTTSALRYIDWEKTTLFVILDIDRILNIPEYLSNEKIWHLIAKINYKKNKKSNFIIQTHNPSHLIFKSLEQPDRFYRTDLNLRKGLNYPPYSYMVRYFYGNTNFQLSKQESEQVYDIISGELTKTQKNAKISGPIEMHPKFYRNKYWHVFLIKLDAKNWPNSIAKINKIIPTGWKIDPNPISILSP